MNDPAVLRLGPTAYEEAWALQRRLAEEVRADPERAYLVLLSHPPVITVGKNGDSANVLDAGEIPVVRVDRGGDVTYHGPGQVVGYPILNLRRYRLGVRAYVGRLEDLLVGALREVGVAAFRRPGAVGVWTAGGKIASIGVRVARGVTLHGFALQVTHDVEAFRRIHPCGEPGAAISSVEREAGRRVNMEAPLIRRFLRLFGRRGSMAEVGQILVPAPLAAAAGLPFLLAETPFAGPLAGPAPFPEGGHAP